MSKPRAVLLVSLCLLVSFSWGCSSQAMLRMPGRLTAVPGTGVVDDKVEAARRLMQEGDHVQALAAVDRVLSLEPRHVDAHRVRQQLLQRRGRTGRLAWEAQERLRKHPDEAWAHYLAGRIQPDNARKTQAFRRALDLDERFFWAWFGLAFVKRNTDPELAKAIYERLYRASRGHRLVALAYGGMLRSRLSAPKALEVYAALEKQAPGLGASGLALTHLATGTASRAWPHVLTALRERPFDPTIHDLIRRYLARGLADDRVQEFLDVLRANTATQQAFARDDAGLLAGLYYRVGEAHAALEVLLRKPGKLAPGERQLLLILQLSTGDVAGFLRELRAGFPAGMLDDEANQVRGPWVTLLRGPWMQRADPLEPLSGALELIRALLNVGLLEEAQRLSSMALLRSAAAEMGNGDDGAEAGAGAGVGAEAVAAAIRELRTEVRREIAFQAGLRRLLNEGYTRFAHKRGSPKDLNYFLDDARRLSQQVLGKDVVGHPRVYQVPFVGRLVDAFGKGLPQHLARYNKHLVLGQRNSRPVEGMMLTRLSLTVVDPVEGIELPANCREVVGERREIAPLLMHDLAGIALLNHYVIDMDQVRSWAQSLLEQRETARQDGMLLRDRLPQKPDPSLPLDVEWRLNLMSPVEDSALEIAVLDLIRWHERGHMVDFSYFLPPTMHPWRSLALLFRNGLSAARVAGEFEARAEVVALARSSHTRLVMAHIAGFLAGDPGSSPHADGFRRLARHFAAELKKQGKPDPGVSRWHELDPALARAIGERLLETLW